MSPADLFAAHTGLVRHLARRLGQHRVQAAGMETDDLVQVGLIALWDCCKRFEEDRGLRFSTFAVHRISGAMRSELRGDALPGGRLGARVRLDLDQHMDRRAGGRDFTDQVDARERATVVRREISKLPARLCRVAVDMMRERPLRDTARRLRVSYQWVKQLRRGAVDMLAAELRQAGVA
jgi:RNA polymerase sigma factor (sigma-70 family)